MRDRFGLVEALSFIDDRSRDMGLASKVRRGTAAVLLTGLLIPLGSSAQPIPRNASGDPAALARPLADTLHALILFARFKDDTVSGEATVEWPLFDDPATLPAFAPSLLAPTPHPPFPDSSLTAYFHQQSLGRFVIYGDVVDSVMVSREPTAAYHRPRGGYGHLTAELLDRLDAGGFDFSRYDHNGDGLLDYLFLIIRGDAERDAKRFVYTGIACLDAACGGGGLTAGRPARTLSYDGLTVDWRKSGAIVLHRTPGNIIPHYYHVRMMAHELGHDLWQSFFTHIPAITSNDVPFTSNRRSGNLDTGTRTIGYVLMAGGGGGLDGRGDETISAFERDLLRWIDCTYLTASRDSIVLTDLYTTSACAKVVLPGDPSGRVLYLTNRQRLGPFDRARRGGADNRFEMGLLRTTGLLVHLADGTALDVLPADNSLDLSPRDAPYAGDLFGPGVATQLTPWTRPNTSGFTRYPTGFEPSWQAIDRIRYTDGTSAAMTFDYVGDFRERPVIREESWMGDEMRGYTFETPVQVTEDAPLHVETDVAMERLRVEPGATVLIEKDGLLRLPPGSVLDLRLGATVIVEGDLRLEGLMRFGAGTRLITRGAGRVLVPLTD